MGRVHRVERAKRQTMWTRVLSQLSAGSKGPLYWVSETSADADEQMWNERMVPGAGVEPATRGFSIRCSTN